MRLSSDPRPPVSQASPSFGRPFTLFVIVAAFLSSALVLARIWNYGPGFGPDQSIYVETARNLLRGEPFTQLDGSPYVLWAPLYPALLAALSLSVFDPRDVVGPLNAVVFGAIALVAGMWIRRRMESRFLAAWSILAIALSLPLAHAASIAFPIVLFILFTTLALINADNYFRERKRSSLAWTAAFSALAWLAHYMGIAVVVGVSALLAAYPSGPLLDKAKRIVFYGLAGSAPIGVWALGILHRTGEFTANRRDVGYYSPGLARDIVAEMSEWAFVNLYIGNLRLQQEIERWPIASAVTAVAVIALFGGICLGVFRSSFDRDRGRTIWNRWSAPFVFGGFALAYLCLYLVALMAGSSWNGAQPRHLLPVYLPLFIAAAAILDNLSARWRIGRQPSLALGGRSVPFSLTGLAAAALALWLAFSAALQPVAIRNANTYGIAGWDVGTYSLPRYVESELVEHVRRLAGEAGVYSNGARPLNLYAPRRPPPQWIPGLLDGLPAWIDDAPNGALVAWFHAIQGYPDYNAADLRATPGLEIVAELSDGALFRVNKAHNPRPAHQAAYNALADREPVVRSAYDVHLDGRTLIYAKSPCSREETAARFFLHVIPTSANDLPDDRKRHGFDNLDFSFEFSGVRLGGACLVSVSLPPYPIAEAATGQFADGERLWEAAFPMPQ